MTQKEIIKLGPVTIEDTIEMLPETMTDNYKNLPYINWEKAKNKYQYKIDWNEASSIVQFYINTLLDKYSEKDLKEKLFQIEIPEAMVPCMSYINQLNLSFRKGDSVFIVKIDRYRILTIYHVGDAYNDSLTWFYDIKNILCTEGVVKDDKYCEFWGISDYYREV